MALDGPATVITGQWISILGATAIEYVENIVVGDVIGLGSTSFAQVWSLDDFDAPWLTPPYPRKIYLNNGSVLGFTDIVNDTVYKLINHIV